MKYKPKQRDIVVIDFAPSKGYEINKRHPALVMSSDNYNRATNLVIVCPITTTEKKDLFLFQFYQINYVLVEWLSAK